MNGLIERFDLYKGKLEDAAASGQGVPVASVTARPVAGAGEYRLHGGQLHGRRHPQRAGADQRLSQDRDAIGGPGDTMVLPDAPATIFEGEAEMAVVIGKRRATSRPPTR